MPLVSQFVKLSCIIIVKVQVAIHLLPILLAFASSKNPINIRNVNKSQKIIKNIIKNKKKL